MTCDALGGYTSEYIQGCDITKWGEGCEKCVPLFNSSWMTVLLSILVIVVVLFILSLLISIQKNGRT